jgi:hypothetical protein
MSSKERCKDRPSSGDHRCECERCEEKSINWQVSFPPIESTPIIRFTHVKDVDDWTTTQKGHDRCVKKKKKEKSVG